MQIRGLSLRAAAALAFLSACGSSPVISEPAAATTPPLMWQQVTGINVLCLVRTDAGVDQGPLHDLVCKKVRDMAAEGSPAPVRIIASGDPAVLSPDNVTLLVHASVQGASGRRLLAFTIRPFRNSADQGQMLFAAVPRAVPLGNSPGNSPELEAALRAALSETLPWLTAPAGHRPIR